MLLSDPFLLKFIFKGYLKDLEFNIIAFYGNPKNAFRDNYGKQKDVTLKLNDRHHCDSHTLKRTSGVNGGEEKTPRKLFAGFVD